MRFIRKNKFGNVTFFTIHLLPFTQQNIVKTTTNLNKKKLFFTKLKKCLHKRMLISLPISYHQAL